MLQLTRPILMDFFVSSLVSHQYNPELAFRQSFSHKKENENVVPNDKLFN